MPFVTPPGHRAGRHIAMQQLFSAEVSHLILWRPRNSGHRMRRREFITLLSGAAVGWPVAANAEQASKIARIGYLSTDLAGGSGLREAFRQGIA